LASAVAVALVSMTGCFAALAAPAGAGAAGCPNEAFRLGASSLLPGCRAYEMVSPPDKSSGNVAAAYNVRASADGEAATFTSIAAFAGAPSSVIDNTYLARRGSTDWGTVSLNPPFSNPTGGPYVYLSPINSPDLTKTLVLTTAALTPGAFGGGSNVYVRDNRTGSLELVVALPSPELFNQTSSIGVPLYITGTSNWSHILFQSPFPLTGETTEGTHLYEFSGGRLELVDRLPDGSISSGSAMSTTTANTNAMSADGSRVFFGATPEGAAGPTLYVRETHAGNATTVPISTIQIPGPEEGELADGSFGAASADGSVVYFTSDQELTPGAETENSSSILYRWDAGNGALTDVTPTTNPAGPRVAAVLAVGEDGSHVYFSAAGKLNGEGSEESGTGNLYALHAGGSPELIGTTEPGTNEQVNPRQWMSSPNGLHFAFSSSSPLTNEVIPGNEAVCPFSNIVGNPPGLCPEVFRYDAAASDLECVSCNGQVPAGPSLLGGFYYRRTELGSSAPHAALDDGTVYIETKDALLPRDRNEAKDVYANRDGTTELVSSGSSPAPSTFGDASALGGNVFFITRQSLVKSDTDNSLDVYDDREGGGLADQWAPGQSGPCQGEGCKGEGPNAPLPIAPGSGRAGAGGGCEALIVTARETAARAKATAGQARRAGRSKSAAAKSRAGRLRHRAGVQKSKAKRAAKRANGCGRQGK
jgi:hypothetical protein